MNRDDHSPADSSPSLGESDASARPADRAERRAPTDERPTRRSLMENWAAFTNPANDEGLDDGTETPSIHVAVSDALDGALPDPTPEASESVDDGALPPPPDRSGTSFGTWDPEGDAGDRPEFFRDIADETSSSASDWRQRLAAAQAASQSQPVMELGAADSGGEFAHVADSGRGLALVEEVEEVDEIAAIVDAEEADKADEDVAAIDEAKRESDEAKRASESDEAVKADEATAVALMDDDDDDAEVEALEDDDEPAVAPVVRTPPPPLPPERVAATVTASIPLTWTPIAVDDIDDEEDDEAALLALARGNDGGERRVMIDRGDADEDAEADHVRPRSRAISGEIIDDHRLGQVVDDDEDDAVAPAASDASAPAAASAAEVVAEVEDPTSAPPRAREAWIDDESDPPPSYYGEAFADELWEDREGLVGRVLLGRYRLDEVLGDGEGFRVHAARTVVGDRPLVVKLMGPEYPADEERARLFRSEGRAMARLEHPRVVEVVDVGATRDGLSFVACARIAGPSLAEYLALEGRLSWANASAILRQVAEVTDLVHHHGGVVRTIHPRNCYVVGEREGAPELVLTNVGVTPLCTTHRHVDGTVSVVAESLVGAAEYLAPEVVSGNLPDPRADVYALGVLLYELLVGAPPFTGDTLINLLKKHLYEPPPRPRIHAPEADIPEPVEALILRALEKDPDARYHSVEALLADLVAAEARQHEVERAKTLLSGLDAALWGDESGQGVALREEPSETLGPRELPPIAPLTDDDKPVEQRSGLPRTTAQLPAIPDREPPKPVAPVLTPEVPPADPAPTFNLLYVVGGVLIALVALILFFRPTGDDEPKGKGPPPTKIADASTHTTSHGDPDEVPPGDPSGAGGSTSPTTAPPIAEVTPPDPSEGALDPSEGALDPSEGALDPSEGALDPSEGGDPVDPDPNPPTKKKPPSGPLDSVGASSIHAKLGAVSKRVSKECGMSGGLFAPVGLTVKLTVTVDPSGRVSASTSGASTKMGTCAIRIVEGLRFPASRRGGSAVHTFKL